LSIDQLGLEKGVLSAQPNSLVENPEGGSGENMSFDDWGSRSAAEYTNQGLMTSTNLDKALTVFPNSGNAVLVAVLDTGGDGHTSYDDGHPAFDGMLDASPVGYDGHGYTWSDSRETLNHTDDDGDGFVDEAAGHGTHVAGIVHLVAPMAHIVAIKVLNDDGWGTVFGLAQGLISARDLRANIVNMSLGLESNSAVVQAAVQAAAADGVMMVASAGNRGGNVPQYPASYKDVVLSVTGVDKNDILWESANRNTDVDLSAPCVDVVSTVPRCLRLHDDYAVGTGTSMAAPLVTGAVAMAMSWTGCTARWAGEIVVENSKNIESANPKYYVGLMGQGRVEYSALTKAPEGN
jgi:subtilisin family serine protease